MNDDSHAEGIELSPDELAQAIIALQITTILSQHAEIRPWAELNSDDADAVEQLLRFFDQWGESRDDLKMSLEVALSGPANFYRDDFVSDLCRRLALHEGWDS